MILSPAIPLRGQGRGESMGELISGQIRSLHYGLPGTICSTGVRLWPQILQNRFLFIEDPDFPEITAVVCTVHQGGWYQRAKAGD